MTAAAVVCAGAASLSIAGAFAHDNQRTVAAVGAPSFVVNKSFTLTYRWAPRVIRVRSGGTVTWQNRIDPVSPEPHTITIAAAGTLPDTVAELAACGGPGTACAPGGGHFGPNNTVPNPVLNAGPPGLDEVGDSLFLPPSSGGNVPTVSAKISAPPGTVLHYLCVIHPWMQGVIRVRRGRHDDNDD